MVVPRLESITIPTPRRSAGIAAGETKLVWAESLSGGFVAFIDRISVTRGDDELGNNNTYVSFQVDGVEIEKIRREISLNLPDRFDPPIVAEKWIKFYAHNGDIEEHQFEVLVQGCLVRPG